MPAAHIVTSIRPGGILPSKKARRVATCGFDPLMT
jgi:hypothetical protein